MKNQFIPSKSSLMAAALAGVFTAAQPALAQSAKDFEDMRQEIKRLRDEVNALKQAAPASAAAAAAGSAKSTDTSGWGERIEQLEIKSKDAVVLGDIGGGFRLPGSETSVRLYGYAEANLIHDFKGFGRPDNFTNLSSQPLNAAGLPKGRTKLTAETSRFGFETSTPTGVGTFNTKLEMDFYAYDGGRNRLRLRHAYGEYGGWLIGQTWSTFMDLDNLPETVDFNGPIGAPFSRRTMIRYTYADGKDGNKFTVALEDPEDQFGGGSANEKMPQLVARFDKSFGWGAVNARVLAHEKRSATATKRGFGFAVGGSYKLTDKDVLMGQYTRVDGDIDQLYGANGYAIDATTGAISFDKNQGLVLGYLKTFNDQLRGNIVLGLNRGKTAQALDNRSLSQFHLGLIYSPLKNVELGGELILGKRKTFNDDVGTLSRFDLMGRYSF